LGGPNLADVPEAVREDLVADAGGPDALAGRAARGVLSSQPRTVHGEWPDEVSPWIYRDLVELRRTVRAASVSVSRGRMGTHEVNPAARLVERLRARRGELVGAPSTYGSVAAKARTAVRGRYLDRVLDRLDERADEHDQREDALADALDRVDAPSLSRIRSGYDARRADSRDDRPSADSAGDPRSSSATVRM
jgi:hypothetical protein